MTTTAEAALKQQARELRTAIDAKTTKAQEAWSAFDAMRKSAVDEGVNFATDKEAFDKLDAAGKAHDALKDEIANDEKSWQRLMQLAGEEAPKGGPTPEERREELHEKAAKTFGSEFVQSKVYQDLVGSGKLERSDIPLGTTESIKTMTREEFKTLIDSTAGSAGDWVRSDRQSFLIQVPSPKLNVLDVVTVGTTDSNTVAYMEETTFTNAAAETAEGTAAAESVLVYDEKTSDVKEITHFIPATRRILADEAGLRTLVDARMLYGVQKRLQDQIVAGDAAGQNLRGLINVAAINAQALGADSRADAVHKAITKIRVAGEGNYEPEVLGIHPNDWEQLRLEKDANGNYLLGPAAGDPYSLVWGLRPLIHTAFTEGNPVAGEYRQAMLWLREGPSIAVSDSHANYFTERKVAILAGLRAAFAVPAPKAFCEITGF